MFLALIAFAAGVVVGAFSHKWLAAEVLAKTGVEAQGVANQVKDAAKKV